MKTCPKSIAAFLSGISFLLATSTAQAGDSFFSFSLGYSNHGYYPHHYFYAPAYIYVVPSPFFFGYTSYYYPVFPYYYTPVVYYRPFLPYRYPYAYYPHRYHHWHSHAYRRHYPGTFFHGHYAHNHYYKYKPYYHYNYPYGRHTEYKFKPRKYQYTALNSRSLVANSPAANKLVQQAPSAQQSIRHSTVNNATREQRRSSELERYRSTLQQHRNNQKPFDINRSSWNEQRTLAATEKHTATQQKPDNQGRNNFTRQVQHPHQSIKTDQNANNERIERLINRDRNPSRRDLSGYNHPAQQIHIARQPDKQGILSNTRTGQINQQSLRGKSEKPANYSLRQQGITSERPQQFNERQTVRQRPLRNDFEGPGYDSFQSQPLAKNDKRNRNHTEPASGKRMVIPERMDISPGGGMSFHQNSGPGMLHRSTSQRFMGGGAGFRR